MVEAAKIPEAAPATPATDAEIEALVTAGNGALLSNVDQITAAIQTLGTNPDPRVQTVLRDLQAVHAVQQQIIAAQQQAATPAAPPAQDPSLAITGTNPLEAGSLAIAPNGGIAATEASTAPVDERTKLLQKYDVGTKASALAIGGSKT